MFIKNTIEMINKEYLSSSDKGMIQSLISKLLYLPPQCSYFRYDGRFLGTYFEVFEDPFFF